MMAVVEKRLTFSSMGEAAYAAELEGVFVGFDDGIARASCVLCHPNPVNSTMDDPVIMATARALAAVGINTLRFNFRGAGNSKGEQTNGKFEPLDIAGAIKTLLTQRGVDPTKLCLIGHAFGAWMILSYAPYDPRVKAVVALSVPMYRIPDGFMAKYNKPKLFITGEFDEVCPRHKLEPYVEEISGPKGMKIVTGARHMMKGKEQEVADVIATFVARWAKLPTPTP